MIYKIFNTSLGGGGLKDNVCLALLLIKDFCSLVKSKFLLNCTFEYRFYIISSFCLYELKGLCTKRVFYKHAETQSRTFTVQV